MNAPGSMRFLAFLRRPLGGTGGLATGRRLLTTDTRAELPFEWLDPLVRTLLHLDPAAAARPHQQRLAAAGYVPLRPFPAANRIAALEAHVPRP